MQPIPEVNPGPISPEPPARRRRAAPPPPRPRKHEDSQGRDPCALAAPYPPPEARERGALADRTRHLSPRSQASVAALPAAACALTAAPSGAGFIPRTGRLASARRGPARVCGRRDPSAGSPGLAEHRPPPRRPRLAPQAQQPPARVVLAAAPCGDAEGGCGASGRARQWAQG